MNLSNINSNNAALNRFAIQHLAKQQKKQPLTEMEVLEKWFLSKEKDIYFFREYKDKISEGTLYELAIVALNRNWSELQISNLFVTIKDKLTHNTLEALASRAIEKMSGSYSTDILIEIKDKISEDQLVKLASIVIEKAVTNDIRRLLVEIKDKITSKDKLYKLASIAIEMSNEYPMWELIELIDEIKDNIFPDQLNKLENQIKLKNPKACCTIM